MKFLEIFGRLYTHDTYLRSSSEWADRISFNRWQWHGGTLSGGWEGREWRLGNSPRCENRGR